MYHGRPAHGCFQGSQNQIPEQMTELQFADPIRWLRLGLLMSLTSTPILLQKY